MLGPISKITYVDARYTYEETAPTNIPLPFHEAYGYLDQRAGCFILTFIQATSPKNATDDMARMGLILPIGSIVSKNSPAPAHIFQNNIPIGSQIALTWQDVVLFESTDRRDCSVMYTEGTLVGKDSTQVIIQNPQTIRTYPTPITNHPGGIPTFLRIPLGMIRKVEVIIDPKRNAANT